MLSLLDKLVEAIQSTSNPVDKIELYLEYIESKNKKSLYNEFFWGKKHTFDEIKILADKAKRNLDLIANVLKTDASIKNDPIVSQIYNKLETVKSNLESELESLEQYKQ